MFVLNKNGHYFEINTKEVVVCKERFEECRFFDDERAMLEVVCSADGLTLEEVEGSTFYITMREGRPMLIDDRCYAHAIDEPVEAFVADFAL